MLKKLESGCQWITWVEPCIRDDVRDVRTWLTLDVGCYVNSKFIWGITTTRTLTNRVRQDSSDSFTTCFLQKPQSWKVTSAKVHRPTTRKMEKVDLCLRNVRNLIILSTVCFNKSQRQWTVKTNMTTNLLKCPEMTSLGFIHQVWPECCEDSLTKQSGNVGKTTVWAQNNS